MAKKKAKKGVPNYCPFTRRPCFDECMMYDDGCLIAIAAHNLAEAGERIAHGDFTC